MGRPEGLTARRNSDRPASERNRPSPPDASEIAPSVLSLLRALGLDAEAWPRPARRDPFETLRDLAAHADRPAGILIFTREKKDELRAHLSGGRTLVVARLDLTSAPCRTCALTMVRLKHGTEVTMSCGCDGNGTEKSVNGFIDCLRGEKRVFWIGEQSNGGE